MNIKSLAIAHGEKVALGVVGAGCLVWLYASICEVSSPMGPKEEALQALKTVEGYLTGSNPVTDPVPNGGDEIEIMLTAHGMVSAELAQVRQRIWYVTPPKGARQVVGSGSEVVKTTVRLKAAWPPPSKLDAKVSLGAVAVSWGLDEEAKHGVPVRFVVMRKKSADPDWQQLAEVPAGEAGAGQWSFADLTVSPKTKYDYRVQAVGTAAVYPDTVKETTIVEPPEGQLDISEEKPFPEAAGGDDGETRKPRLLWFSKYSEAKSAVTPSDVQLYMKGTVGGEEMKASMVVMKFDPKKGWQRYEAPAVAVKQKIMGTRKVWQEKDGRTERVDEMIDSDCKLLEIYDQVETREVEVDVLKVDPATGKTYKVKEKRATLVRIQKLKVIDLTLNEEFWAPSVKDKEPPAEGSGAIGAEPTAARTTPVVAPQQPAAGGTGLVPGGRSRSSGPAVTPKVEPAAAETPEEAAARRARETLERIEKERADRMRKEQEAKDARTKATDDKSKRTTEEEYLRQLREREMPAERTPGVDEVH